MGIKSTALLTSLLALCAGLALANPLLDIDFWRTAAPGDVERAVQQGAKVDARDEGGWTPLHWAAARSDNPEVVLALLELGADPKARTLAGSTAWDLIQSNQKLRGTPAYWKLNDLRF